MKEYIDREKLTRRIREAGENGYFPEDSQGTVKEITRIIRSEKICYLDIGWKRRFGEWVCLKWAGGKTVDPFTKEGKAHEWADAGRAMLILPGKMAAISERGGNVADRPGRKVQGMGKGTPVLLKLRGSDGGSRARKGSGTRSRILRAALNRKEADNG